MGQSGPLWSKTCPEDLSVAPFCHRGPSQKRTSPTSVKKATMVREEGQGATEEGDVSSSELHSPVSLILHNLHPPMHCFALHSLLTLKPHLLNNAAAHCPLCLVTRLHCRKQSDNAWLDVPDKTTLSFLSHFPPKFAFSPRSVPTKILCRMIYQFRLFRVNYCVHLHSNYWDACILFG